MDSLTTQRRAPAPVTPSASFCPMPSSAPAVGRFNYTTSATYVEPGNGPTGRCCRRLIPMARLPRTTTRTTPIVGGFTVGLGVDVAILPNVFRRGEWEFVGLPKSMASAPRSIPAVSCPRQVLAELWFPVSGYRGSRPRLPSRLSPPVGPPLPNEGRLSGRIDS